VTDAGIETFWTWWPEACARISAAIADRKLDLTFNFSGSPCRR
jgi:hypothetical protein